MSFKEIVSAQSRFMEQKEANKKAEAKRWQAEKEAKRAAFYADLEQVPDYVSIRDFVHSQEFAEALKQFVKTVLEVENFETQIIFTHPNIDDTNLRTLWKRTIGQNADDCAHPVGCFIVTITSNNHFRIIITSTSLSLAPNKQFLDKEYLPEEMSGDQVSSSVRVEFKESEQEVTLYFNNPQALLHYLAYRILVKDPNYAQRIISGLATEEVEN